MSGSGGKKLTVPKFSSFKPKAPVPAPLSPSTATKGGSERQGSKDEIAKERRSRHESRHREDRHKHREHHSDHRPERRRDGKRSRSRSPEKSLVVAQTDVSGTIDERASNGIFFIDKKGDPLIRRYGGNDRSRVPLYRRGGGGRVLGSDGYLQFHRDGPREQFSIRLPGEGSSTVRDRLLFHPKVHRIKTKRIRSLNEISVPVEEDFVPLNKSSKRQRTEEPESSADEKPSYRSIEGKAKAHEFSDSELEYDSDPQGGNLNIDVDDPLKQRSIQLSRHVKDHPEDISKWLELIAHQDVLLKANQSLNREVTKGEIQSFAGIKISMYESALAQVKKPEDEERLLLGMMAEGAIAWSSEKLDKRWEAIANEQGSSFCLWRARVDHKLASLTTFKYGDLKAAHVDRLRAVTAQSSVSVSPAPGCGVTPNGVPRYEQMIYVFLRATRLAFDAGYRELAIAAWQALLEVNLQRPYTDEGMADSELLSLFRDFWEDEVPRIGDNNAQGWNHYVQSNGAADSAEQQRDEDAVVPSRDVYKSWGATERLRASNARKPGRATDDILMDDPYRVVMFSDIEDLLFVIPKEHVPHIWKQLIDGFLIFCSLPPAFRSSKWTEAAESDGVLAGCLSLFGKEAVQKANEPDVLDETKKSPVFMQDGIHLANASDILFGTHGWFLYLSGWVNTSKTHDGPVDLGLVAHALRQLTAVERFSDLAEYSLAVDINQDPDNTKKRAKALIKRSPTNLPLYNAYALAEFANGNREVARQVVSSATGLINSSNQRHGLVLWRTWAWMELEAGFKEQAILRLCASVDEFLSHNPELTSATPTQQLKAHHYLSSRLEHQLSSRQLEDAVLTGECQALLAYLTSRESSEPIFEAQGSITSAMERIWSVSSALCVRGQAKSQDHEILLQAGARILYHYATRGPFRRIYLREQLMQCIELFPRNTMFLTLFSWASTTFGIEDPVREMLQNVALSRTNDCVSNRLFAIRYELQRGNVHSTRAAFERALDSPACRLNPELWRCYIRFNNARKQFRSKAKDVFFRGLRYCPWSKDVAMEAFTSLINVMDEVELRSVFNTLTAKGLRTHVDLDEFVAQHDQSGRGR